MGAEVVGVSTDDHQTQCEFAASVKANFPMIGDPDGTIARAFDVFWTFIKLVRRMTFVIDQQGIVRAVLSHDIRVQAHIDESIQVVSRLVRKTSGDPTGSTGKTPVLKS